MVQFSGYVKRDWNYIDRLNRETERTEGKRMSKQPSKIERELLARILHNTWISVVKHRDYGDKFITQHINMITRSKAEREALGRLRKRGLVEEYSLELTADGYAFLGTTKRQVCINRLQADLDHELQQAARLRITDTLRLDVDKHRLQFFRELYNDPTFTVEQVIQHERERLFNNRSNYEQRMQALEHEISRAEHARP